MSLPTQQNESLNQSHLDPYKANNRLPENPNEIVNEGESGANQQEDGQPNPEEEQDQEEFIGSFSTSQLAPLRYFREDIPPKVLAKTNYKTLTSKFEEEVYGIKMTNREKHQMIMDLILHKRRQQFKKTKREKRLNQQQIKRNKSAYLRDNKRKMLEVKWKLKLADISKENHRSKIDNNHWRIGEYYESHKKLEQPKNLRRRIYTPETKEKLKRRLRTFDNTNEFGLTAQQEKEFEEMHAEKKRQIEITRKKLADGRTYIVKKTILKRYKVQKEDEEEAEEEAEEEQEVEEEEQLQEEEVDEENDKRSQSPEKEEENKEVKKEPVVKKKSNRYEPLYPTFVENQDLDDDEFEDEKENTGEEKKVEDHNDEF